MPSRTAPSSKVRYSRPLTEAVDDRQRSSRETRSITSAARRGLSGSARPFPHAERIRQAFGRHAPSGLTAHIGPQARRAGAAIGADAYVLDGQAAFTRAPDLHTAAHEAFHLYEQSPGRRTRGKAIGHESDRSELTANRVADAVVAGRPVEPLLAQAPAAPAALQMVKHAKVSHQQAAMKSSKLRFFRRLQYAIGGSRNLAMLKMERDSGGVRNVLYVIARSMGLGVSKLTLGDEEITTQAGTPKKRSHSEAVLRATLEVGSIKAGGTTYDLSGYKVLHGVSTNEACGSEHENCSVESVPFLTEMFYFAQKYGGTDDAQGFEKLNNQFQAKVRKGTEESDDESETENSVTKVNVVIVDEDQFVGRDLQHAKPAHIDATPFSVYFAAAPKANKRARIYDRALKPKKEWVTIAGKKKLRRSRVISGI